MMRAINNLSIKAKLALSFAAILISVMLMGVYVHTSVSTIKEATLWNAHTYKVLDSIDAVVAGMVGQETGLRGYLVSGKPEFLEPYNAGIKQAQDGWARAKQLTADNPAQQRRLDELKSAIGQWQQGVAEREIALMRDAATAQQARDLEASGAGKTAFDTLRRIAAEFRHAEAELLVTRTAAEQEAMDGAQMATWIGMTAALVLATLLGVLLARGISTPVVRISGVMRHLASGDNSVEVPFRDRRDEIGMMAGSVQVFKDNALEMERLQAEQEATKRRAEQERKAAMLKLADGFEMSVKGIVETVASAATEMQGAATAMSRTAEDASQQAMAVASASEQASVNVQTVATATEELSSSIQEIGRQVTNSATIAGQAVQETQRTAETIATLVEAARQIEAVVSLINSIANQTNLLALNATIEAARAGDAGKGFAVVASEVKALAAQTSNATDEIQAKVSEIQNATVGAKTAMEGVGRTIAEMNEIASAIAAAVEEQGAATRDISANIQQAAQGTEIVTSSISNVNRAAAETGSAAVQVLGAAGGLSKEAEMLRREVTDFIATVRAA